MPKQYCPNCGAANEYSISAPASCGKCKQSMNVSLSYATASVIPAPVQQQPVYVIPVAPTAPQPQPRTLEVKRRIQARFEDDDEDDYQTEQRPAPVDIDEFEFDSLGARGMEKVSLGELMQGSETSIDTSRTDKGLSPEQRKEKRQQVLKRIATMQRNTLGGSNTPEQD